MRVAVIVHCRNFLCFGLAGDIVGIPKIFLTGDCHGDYTRFSTKRFPEQKEMARDDFVIIMGDFGYWSDSAEQRQWRKWLEEKPFTVLFVDGNHENFDMLKTLPVEHWNNGKIHRVGDNIIHLMRGQVYEFAGRKWFAMGGAPSHDIHDGILDPKEEGFRKKYMMLSIRGAMFRVLGRSWWPEEMPCVDEYKEADHNLSANENKVDFVLSHEAPLDIAHRIGRGHYTSNDLSIWFDERILKQVDFKAWFFGHYHIEYNFHNIFGMYKSIVNLEEIERNLKRGMQSE